MARARVQGGFLYAQTHPVGPLPKPESTLFNKQVFFKPQTHPVGLRPTMPPQAQSVAQ